MQNFENLSKEELLTKCKSLIVISKKAKIAKDGLATELEKLKADHLSAIQALNEKRKTANGETCNSCDCNAKLSENAEELCSKNSEIENLSGALDKFTKEKNDLEKQLENSIKESSNFKNKCSSLQEQCDKLSEKNNELKALKEFSDELTGKLKAREEEKQELESLLNSQKVEINSLNEEVVRLKENIEDHRKCSSLKIIDLEEKLMLSERSEADVRVELNSMKEEFDAYKLKAQNILKQKARFPDEQVADLKADVDDLHSKLQFSQSKIRQLESEVKAVNAKNQSLLTEKEKISALLANLSQESRDKQVTYEVQISSLEKRLQLKVDELQRVTLEKDDENALIKENLKRELQTLKQVHADQIQILKSEIEFKERNFHKSVMNHLSQENTFEPQLEASLMNQATVSQSSEDAEVKATLSECLSLKCDSTDTGSISDHNTDNPDFERGKNRRTSNSNPYKPPSLEFLISSQSLNGDTFAASEDDTNEMAKVSAKELSNLQSKITTFELRVSQLSTLLADSEAENAKLIQLCEALKEEIRRCSRNETREKHLENNEYIKNVILKFLSLDSGDDRFRLIPILKTLLQLSPEEVSSLMNYAQGSKTSKNQSSSNWSGYLHLWSGK